MEKGDFPLAIEKLTKSAEMSPHFKTYECLGESYLLLGEPQQAIMFLAAAAGLGNRQFRSYFLLAQALLGLNELEKAREKLNQALAMNPEYKAARELLSSISDD